MVRKWLAGGVLFLLLAGAGGCAALLERGPRVPKTAVAEPVAGAERPAPAGALTPVPFDPPAGTEPSPWQSSSQASYEPPKLGPVATEEGWPDLTIAALPSGTGWEVTSAPWSVSGLGTTEFDGPTGSVLWLDGDRALFRWYRKNSTRFGIAETATGRLRSLAGYKEIDSASPDGRYLILQRETNMLAAVLIDTRTGQESWNLPVGYAETQWLNDRLFLFYHDRNRFVGDAVRRVAWPLPERSPLVVALGNQVCYSFEESSKGRTTGVNCLDTGSGALTSLLLPGEQVQASSPYPPDLWADPSGRFLVTGYRRTPAKAAGLRLSGVAHATKPLPPMVWTDTLLVYDAREQSLRRLALPHLALIRSAAWSPGGAYLGLQLNPENADPYTAVVKGYLWSLELATGKMQRVSEAGSDPPAALLFTMKDGSLLVNRSTVYPPRLALLSPGMGEAAWEPDRKALQLTPPGPPWWKGPLPPRVAVTDGSRLLLYTESGETYTWALPAGGAALGAHATPSPAFRWVAIQKTNQGKSGRLLLLPR